MLFFSRYKLVEYADKGAHAIFNSLEVSKHHLTMRVTHLEMLLRSG